MMDNITATNLRKEVSLVLKKQGYAIKPQGIFVLKKNEREEKRKAHELAKAERVNLREQFLLDKIPFIKNYLINGRDLNIEKIEPEIIEVESNSREENLFRWWNIIWWSLPYERAYGRQMRFLIWDKYHNAPIGLIGLQSPLLRWSARDNYLGIEAHERDFWVNQSLNAQRIGALPPYNDIRGGKLVTLLMTAEVIRKKFQKKYKNQETVLLKRKLPADLLFITTTGAYGKSSVYNRLKYNSETVAKFIGYTQGSGTFHIPNTLYKDLVAYLGNKGFDIKRGYGSGPSRKMRLIDQALQLLGFTNGITHGIQRAVYLFPMVKNVKEVIQENESPIWYRRNVSELADFWKWRWAKPHASYDKTYHNFSSEEFVNQTLKDLEKYKHLCASS